MSATVFPVVPIPAAEIAREPAAWVAPTWEQVVQEHGARVYRLAYRLAGNAQDAEDLTQDTFIRVFRSMAQFTPGTFEGWLHRITTNLFLDMVRRRQRIRFDALPEDTERLRGSAPGPEQLCAETHLDPQIQTALDALAPEFRAAVVLCDIEGLTYEEIAATLGVKLGTVRSRIHRGRVQLREALAHLAPAGRADPSSCEGRPAAGTSFRADRSGGSADREEGVMGSEPTPAGDYSYDLAHDVPRREQTAAHHEPDRPRSRAVGSGGSERGVDLGYDEAHDF